MIYCDYCQQENSDDSSYCQECGNPIVKEVNPYYQKSHKNDQFNKVNSKRPYFTKLNKVSLIIMVLLLNLFKTDKLSIFLSTLVIIGVLVIVYGWYIFQYGLNTYKNIRIRYTPA